MSEIKQVALQNQIALDYVLAIQGREYYTNITDQTPNIVGHL